MFNWFKKKQAPAMAKENTKREKKESLEDYKELFQSTIKPYIKIDAKPESDLPPWQSKFGGTPYMPEGVIWPQMSDGSDLHLLAQINFAEVPELDPFPQKGILQFWLGVNDLYGLDFADPVRQDSFRLVYYPDLEKTGLQTAFGDKLKWNESSPFGDDCPSFSLSFSKEKMPVNFDDFQADKLLKNLPEALVHDYMDAFDHTGHRIGGYAHFTQSDPRESKYEYSVKDILLLQIDSDDKNNILWGDCGVANFFISERKLKALDFSKVLYNWDCC